MKAFANILKVLTALAAVAGAVYVIATYGDQIVAWAKKMLAAMPKCPCCQEAEPEVVEEITPEEATEEDFAEEAPAAEEEAPAAEEAPAEEADEPVAAEEDFAE